MFQLSHLFILKVIHPFSLLASSWAQDYRAVLDFHPSDKKHPRISSCCSVSHEDCISPDAFSPAVGFFQTQCCLRPRTTTTPSGRRGRSCPVPNTPTSWKRSSRLLVPKPSQTCPPPRRSFLHPRLSFHSSYPVSEFGFLCSTPSTSAARSAWWFDDVSLSIKKTAQSGRHPQQESVITGSAFCVSNMETRTPTWVRENKGKKIPFYCTIVTSLLLPGRGTAAVHRPERVDPRQLRTLVRWGVRGRRRRLEECPHGGSQREKTCKANLQSCQSCLSDGI